MTRTKQKAAGPREARANGQQNTTIAAAEQVPSPNSPHMNFGKSQSRRSNPGPISKGERRVQNERAAAVAHPRPHLLPFSVSDMLTAIHKQYFSTIQGVLSLYFVMEGPLACIQRTESGAILFVHQVLNHKETPPEVMSYVIKRQLLHFATPNVLPAPRVGKRPRLGKRPRVSYAVEEACVRNEVRHGTDCRRTTAFASFIEAAVSSCSRNGSRTGTCPGFRWKRPSSTSATSADRSWRTSIGNPQLTIANRHPTTRPAPNTWSSDRPHSPGARYAWNDPVDMESPHRRLGSKRRESLPGRRRRPP